jgi:transposase-like protein
VQKSTKLENKMKSKLTAEQIEKIVQESYAYQEAIKDVARKFGVYGFCR